MQILSNLRLDTDGLKTAPAGQARQLASKQNDMSLKIPAETVLNTYQRIEDSLHSVLQVVPYCDNHKQVWSDYLVTVILEACSLLDSLWRAQSMQSSCVQKAKKRNDLNMFDYFKYYGEYMEPKWVVFWAEEPVMKYPFKGWSKTGQYKTRDDQDFLDWWTAYNNLNMTVYKTGLKQHCIKRSEPLARFSWRYLDARIVVRQSYKLDGSPVNVTGQNYT